MERAGQIQGIKTESFLLHEDWMGKVKADGMLRITGETNSGNGHNLFNLDNTEVATKPPGRDREHASSYLDQRLRRETGAGGAF